MKNIISATAPHTAAISLALTASLAAPAFAQQAITLDETVVSANFVPLDAAKIGSAYSVLDEETIKNAQVTQVSDLLKMFPGVAVSRTAGRGSLTEIRMRGAEANHVLVTIDGIEVNSEATSGGAQFSGLIANDIARIEVLRGPQSALTGSDALAGVINIITHKGAEKAVSRIGVELGQDKTNNLNVLFSGKEGNAHYKLSAQKTSSDGFSAAQNGSEADGFETQTFSIAGGTKFANDWQLDGQLSSNNSRTDIDGTDFSTGALIDTPDDTEVDQNLMSVSLSKAQAGFKQTFKLANTDTSQAFRSAAFGASTTENQRTKLSWQGDWQLAPAHGVSALIEQEKDDYEQIGASATDPSNQMQSSTDHALALEYRYDQQTAWFASASLRKDLGDLYDGSTTYRLSSAYLTENGKLHASLGTGVANPSFIETFGFFPGSFIGNPSLKPEKSTGFDIGYEHHFDASNTTLDITFFKANLENEIRTVFNPDFTSTVENLDKNSERSGYELSLRTAMGDNMALRAAYTFTQSEDGNNKPELRRPEKVASISIAHNSLQGRLHSQLDLSYVGEQLDTDFSTFSEVTLDAYALADMKLRYQLNEKVGISARLENAFDEQYQNVVGYATPGRQFFLGVKADL